MLNWLQAKWQQISEFYGDSFVYNVKNMVGRDGGRRAKKPTMLAGGWSRGARLVFRRSAAAAEPA